ncbi:hypothetical protein T4E_5109 [Trichinella pseudospiralis]|uniref:Uncharacterized protein n=1 Tax=Trichinella pseudospiralis TaxID=6337 RepID=A0A0V0YG76_TRIPS|nr:hypothetical protein T4E_5109 [Trichinella pseudospiralis]
MEDEILKKGCSPILVKEACSGLYSSEISDFSRKIFFSDSRCCLGIEICRVPNLKVIYCTTENFQYMFFDVLEISKFSDQTVFAKNYWNRLEWTRKLSVQSFLQCLLSCSGGDVFVEVPSMRLLSWVITIMGKNNMSILDSVYDSDIGGRDDALNVISASFAQEYLGMLKSSGFAFTVRVTQFAWLYVHGKKALSSETRTNNKAMHNFYVALFEKNNKNCALKRERLSTVGWISLIWAIFVELHRMCKEKCE